MASQPDRFVIYALHQAAVARDHPGAMIDQAVTEHSIEMPFGHRHAHAHCQPLAQRAGGAFNSRQHEILRVASAGAAQLTEVADVLDGRLLIARKIQQAVDQHRAVARRKHETIAIGPVGCGWIEFEIFRPQNACDIGHAHRHPGVARVRSLHGIH